MASLIFCPQNLENTDGIKNEEGLKLTLQSALSGGIEVNIASYTGYSNAVRRIIENHLGLSKEQADSISVFGKFPENYDTQLQGAVREQQSQVGKNLHICRAIVEYKDKHGELPKTVMLVDDDAKNIEKINEFIKSMGTRKKWLEENVLSVEDIRKIKFEGVPVPQDKNGKIVEGIDYLERVQGFINANLIQESEFMDKNPTYTETISLEQQFDIVKKSFDSYGRETINAICRLLKKEVITGIKEQGYNVNSEEGESDVTVYGNKSIDINKIKIDCIDTSLIQIIELDEERSKNLGNNYEDNQLKQEISKLLDANLQKENVNSNPISRQAAASPRSSVKEVEIDGVAIGNSRWFVM